MVTRDIPRAAGDWLCARPGCGGMLIPAADTAAYYDDGTAVVTIVCGRGCQTQETFTWAWRPTS